LWSPVPVISTSLPVVLPCNATSLSVTTNSVLAGFPHCVAPISKIGTFAARTCPKGRCQHPDGRATQYGTARPHADPRDQAVPIDHRVVVRAACEPVDPFVMLSRNRALEPAPRPRMRAGRSLFTGRLSSQLCLKFYAQCITGTSAEPSRLPVATAYGVRTERASPSSGPRDLLDAGTMDSGSVPRHKGLWRPRRPLASKVDRQGSCQCRSSTPRNCRPDP